MWIIMALGIYVYTCSMIGKIEIIFTQWGLVPLYSLHYIFQSKYQELRTNCMLVIRKLGLFLCFLCFGASIWISWSLFLCWTVGDMEYTKMFDREQTIQRLKTTQVNKPAHEAD